MIVVDASALTDVLLARPEAIDGLRQALGGRDHEPLNAPELVEPETLNALRRLVNAAEISERRATEAVSDLSKARLTRYPHAPLRGRVWELRDELTAHDATYLALAEALDGALLTSDAGLAARARRSLGGNRVFQVA